MLDVRRAAFTAFPDWNVFPITWDNPGWVRTKRPPPGVERVAPRATEDILRLRGSVQELAADGARVAVAECTSISLWQPGAAVTPIAPRAPSCDRFVHGREIFSLALAGADAGWATGSAAGNSSEWIGYVSLAGGAPVPIAPRGALMRSRNEVADELVRSLLGSGSLLVFSTVDHCDGYPGRSCPGAPAGQTTATERIWRVREPGYSGLCPGERDAAHPGPCQLLATGQGPLSPLAVDDRHVLARRADGALVVLDGGGVATRTLLFESGEVLGAELDGRDIVVLTQGLLRRYDLDTGEHIRTYALPAVRSSGFCGLSLGRCGGARLRLEDLSGGLVAYVLDGMVHLLRLRDGADVASMPGEMAQLTTAGLFVGWNVEESWRGRVRFVPFRALPLA
jgi:hypothetical protein